MFLPIYLDFPVPKKERNDSLSFLRMILNIYINLPRVTWSPCLQVIVKFRLWGGPDTLTQSDGRSHSPKMRWIELNKYRSNWSYFIAHLHNTNTLLVIWDLFQLLYEITHKCISIKRIPTGYGNSSSQQPKLKKVTKRKKTLETDLRMGNVMTDGNYKHKKTWKNNDALFNIKMCTIAGGRKKLGWIFELKNCRQRWL